MYVDDAVIAGLLVVGGAIAFFIGFGIFIVKDKPKK
ncbi:cytochrome c oxidase subunit CcoM [Oceanospirillum multiglobuliferum]|nr:cytochrome c oxidase subunit CcoM [Oceanospirillum multiglobuliferum]